MSTITKDDLNFVDFRRDREAQLSFKKHFKRLAALKKPYEMSWAELHEGRTIVTGEMEQFLDLMQKEKRDFTLSEDMGYRTGEDMLEWIAEEFQRRNDANTKDPIPGNKFDCGGHTIYHPDGTREYPGVGQTVGTFGEGYRASLREVLKPETINYRSLFPNVQSDNGGWPRFGEFVRAALSGRYEPKLHEARGFTEGLGEHGGFSVPEGFWSEIFSLILEESPLLRSVRLFPMQSPSLTIPCWNMSDFTSSNGIAGITTTWSGELQTVNEQTGKMRTVTLSAKKIRTDTALSREVLFDNAVNLEREVSRLLIAGVNAELERCIINGSGANQPLGVIQSDSALKVSRAGAGAIAFNDLANMYKKLHKGYLKGAMFIMNHDAIYQLMTMTINGNPVWMANMYQGSAQPVPQSLFGLPIYFSQFCPSVGSKGDVILVAPSEYAFGIRQGAQIDRSEHAKWETDEVALRCIMRADGTPLWNTHVTTYEGSTLSWAVVLE